MDSLKYTQPKAPHLRTSFFLAYALLFQFFLFIGYLFAKILYCVFTFHSFILFFILSLLLPCLIVGKKYISHKRKSTHTYERHFLNTVQLDQDTLHLFEAEGEKHMLYSQIIKLKVSLTKKGNVFAIQCETDTDSLALDCFKPDEMQMIYDFLSKSVSKQCNIQVSKVTVFHLPSLIILNTLCLSIHAFFIFSYVYYFNDLQHNTLSKNAKLITPVPLVTLLLFIYVIFSYVKNSASKQQPDQSQTLTVKKSLSSKILYIVLVFILLYVYFATGTGK